ncbi:MAG: GNAT family N-acetyltransferase [Limisphaerales bacterium]
MDKIRRSPLFLDGWLEFNQRHWNLQPLRVRHAPEGAAPAIETVLYLDSSGRIVHPKLNPYVPIAFEVTPTPAAYRRQRQWMAVADLLAAEMRERGVQGVLRLTPEVRDVRPWQWTGFHASVSYTFCIDYPFDFQSVDGAIRNKVRAAQKAGYTCRRTREMKEVLPCLVGTEGRQHFRHELTLQSLELARELLGDDHLVAHVCCSPSGEPVSACVDLYQPGSRVLGWVAGTRPDHLQPGAAQALLAFLIQEYQAMGASSFDLTGANIRGVAAAKLGWGAHLTPYFRIESYGLRSVLGWAREWYCRRLAERK